MTGTVRCLLLPLLLCLVSLPVTAAQNGLYLNLKLGTTDVDTSFGGAFQQIIDGDDDSLAYEVGFRFSPHWAIQAGYHDFGTVAGSDPTCDLIPAACTTVVVPVAAESTAYSLSLVPQLALGERLSLFGKIGLVAWESKLHRSVPPGELIADSSEEDLIWGLGVRLTVFGPFDIFYEYEGVGDEIETQAFGLSFQF